MFKWSGAFLAGPCTGTDHDRIWCRKVPMLRAADHDPQIVPTEEVAELQQLFDCSQRFRLKPQPIAHSTMTMPGVRKGFDALLPHWRRTTVCRCCHSGSQMLRTSIVVTVDGPAASGKGTLAKLLASRLNLAHLDTGLLYRALGLAALQSGINLTDAASAARLTSTIDWASLSSNPELRTEAVGQAASVVSTHPEVRSALLGLQRDFAAHTPGSYTGAVLDGRDIGTVVCPAATAKLFITADVAVRAQRRHQELLDRAAAAAGHIPPAEAGTAGAQPPAGATASSTPALTTPSAAAHAPSYEQVLQDMLQRDARDSSRSVAPCVPAADALVLDTSHLDPQEVLEAAVAYVCKKADELEPGSASAGTASTGRCR